MDPGSNARTVTKIFQKDTVPIIFFIYGLDLVFGKLFITLNLLGIAYEFNRDREEA